MSTRARPQLSVIVPVHNGEATLEEVLRALRVSELPKERWELIVVDDASSDGSAELARRFANQVVRLEAPPSGPAFARNRGAEVARGECLAFVDADVVVHPDTLGRMLEGLADASDVVAVFGSYDTEPRARGLVTEYRNLLHHRVHSSRPGDADTFWAGLGAIRRAEFLRMGGFDDARYPRPQIEDIELGYRLRARGHRIVLDPAIQGTHLKRWTLRDLLLGDVLNRGLPWARLLLERRLVGAGSLNIELQERVLTVLAVAGVVALPVALLLRSWALLAVGTGFLGAVVVSNAPLLLWFSRVRGPWFAAGVVPLRLLYYLLNGISVGLAVLQHLVFRFRGERPPAPPAASPPEAVSTGSSASDPSAEQRAR